jgi:hypothetical protein
MRAVGLIGCLLAMPAMVAPALAQDPGLVLWGKIHEVFSHPRCANCHVGTDHVPIWSGDGQGAKGRPHGMNISGGPSRTGDEHIVCTACHGQHNSELEHGPPGAQDDKGRPIWHLAPLSMQWFGLSSARICAQIKDRTRNGDRSIADVAKHVEDEPLVRWGWTPGPGREAPPYSATEVSEFLKQWDAARAPCPRE